jgi:V8-like Glu-specific endopeptidase
VRGFRVDPSEGGESVRKLGTPWIGVIVMMGCAADMQGGMEEAAVLQSQPQTSMVNDDWVGYSLGLQAPVLRDRGPATLHEDQGPPDVVRISASLTENDDEYVSTHADDEIVMGRDGREYLVKLPVSAELDRLVEAKLDAELERALAALEAPPQQEEEGALDKGVNGSDDRLRYGIAEGYGTGDWLATVGVLTLDSDYNSTKCTGTLISSNLVLTAAHCVVKPAANGSAYIRPMAFHPRADRSQATRYPLGNWSWANSYYYDPNFVSSNCYANYKQSCAKYDWAVIKVNRPTSGAGASLNLYMRYKTVGNAAMTTLKNRGYPGCGLSDSPPNCISHTVFGDPNFCAPGITDNSNDGGYSMAVTHSCDTNPGHSGSAVYFFDTANAGKPTVVGVHVADSGVAGDIAGTGNWMRHVTPAMVSKINTLLSTL